MDVKSLYQEDLLKSLSIKVSEYKEYMKLYKFNNALEVVINIANEANLFIDREAPWALRKTDLIRMNQALYMLIEKIRYIAILLLPFMPDSMNKLLDQLGVKKTHRQFDCLNIENALEPGNIMPSPQGIFPRIN